ncbi:V-set and immunoglobulin domain-containing protein 8a isoform X1 [Scleropages formosus]|uniref:V-set and immunoglobulin domain-containing protein 8a isoform X1 n=2 Tax=Scleropages formosus TaxID=113540 RepID=UPI0010FAA969|nr:coxsackievirus and adenovirus receptor homolog isoform X1 [Scleropages formosus]
MFEHHLHLHPTSNRSSEERPHVSIMSPWALTCSALIFYLNAGATVAMQVTSTGPQTIQKAQGDNVTLGCEYTVGPSDIGELDIEWSSVSPDTTQKDELIISFTGNQKYTHGTLALAEGVDFTATDPSKGDASVTISSLTSAHTGTYQCKVRKGPGVDMRKVTLVVLVRPSAPKCWMEGSETVGGAISLHCKSSEGTTPITYVWKKGSAGVLPPNVTQNSVTGELLIANHSESSEGTYQCEAQNAVGTSRCRFILHVVRPPNKSGVIVGIVVGVFLLVILLLMFIWFLFCLWDKRRYQKKVANEIREDATAHLSRTPSRFSGRRSMAAYSSVRSTTSRASGRRSPDSWLLGAGPENRYSYPG